MAGNIFSVSTGVTDAGGSAPRKVLPTLKSRTTLGAVRKSKSNIESAEPPLSASHCLMFSPCGTAGNPQTELKRKMRTKARNFYHRSRSYQTPSTTLKTLAASHLIHLQLPKILQR